MRAHDPGREFFSPCEEGFNRILAGRGVREIVETCLRSNQNPLPIFVQKGWRALAGDPVETERLFSALLGACAAVASGCAVAPLAGRRAGVCAGLLVACSASAVLHARLIREYSLLTLLAALSLHAFARLRRRGGARRSVLLALLLTAGLHTHAAFAGLLLSLLALALLDATPRAALRRLAAPLAASLLLYAPWPAALALREGNPVWHLYRSTGSYLENVHGASALAAPAWLFVARDRAAAPGAAPFAAGLLVFALLAASIAGSRRARALALASLAPFLAGLLVFNALGRDDLVRARYLLPVLPLLAASLAAGALRARPRGRGIAALLVLCAVSAASSVGNREADEEPRLVREGVAALARLVMPGDLVVVEPPLVADFFTACPAGWPVRTLRQRDEVGAFTDQPVFVRAESASELLAAAGEAPRVVYWFYPYFEEARHGNPFAERLARIKPAAGRIPVGEGHVTVYGRR